MNIREQQKYYKSLSFFIKLKSFMTYHKMVKIILDQNYKSDLLKYKLILGNCKYVKYVFWISDHGTDYGYYNQYDKEWKNMDDLHMNCERQIGEIHKIG